jgi:hypothetical protein
MSLCASQIAKKTDMGHYKYQATLKEGRSELHAYSPHGIQIQLSLHQN